MSISDDPTPDVLHDPDGVPHSAAQAAPNTADADVTAAPPPPTSSDRQALAPPSQQALNDPPPTSSDRQALAPPSQQALIASAVEAALSSSDIAPIAPPSARALLDDLRPAAYDVDDPTAEPFAPPDIAPIVPDAVRHAPPLAYPLMSPDDVYLFNEGSLFRAYHALGAHLGEHDGQQGVWFAVWAPNAAHVSVFGSFNGWDRGTFPLQALGQAGVWYGFVPHVVKGDIYKYVIRGRNGHTVEKADPYAYHAETPPHTGSIVWDLGYTWNDGAWMDERVARNALDAPISIYELHLGSWRHNAEEGRPLSYVELAEVLPRYVADLGFTHVEFMPITEYPFSGSWGYQVTGYFAPTSRFGTPQDFMYLVDVLHQHGLGVILDWVPSHFPEDMHGLGLFDGTHLYEHADPRQGFHPDWKSLIFNYGRNEVVSFLISSALFWLDVYHIDGIRVDAVASMLYLNYSRAAGEWVPNKYGGHENLDAIHFLRRLNAAVYASFPDVQTIAEESTSWPMVSRPLYLGGLGFGFKWDMGWMHDTLHYLAHPPVFRRYHHNELTFRSVYAFSENFMLPLSHDEVVHGKGSLIAKMPGDAWQRFANLRLLYALMIATPGKKLIFMGAEFAQWREWNHDASLDWHLLGDPAHQGILALWHDLNALYKGHAAMHVLDADPAGFQWIDGSDAIQSVFSYIRRPREGDKRIVVCVFNFTPVPRPAYQLGVPYPGHYREVLNTDALAYGGSDVGNFGGLHTEDAPCHGHPYSLTATLPPLAALFFAWQPATDAPDAEPS